MALAAPRGARVVTPLTPDGATPPLREPSAWIVGLGVVVLVLLGLALAACERAADCIERRSLPAGDAPPPAECVGEDCSIPGG